MELGVHCQRGAFGGMRGGELIGRLRVAEIEQLARQHPPLDPPRVGIDQRGGVLRRFQHDGGGLAVLLGPAQPPRFREGPCRPALCLGHRGHQALRVLLVAGDGGECLDQCAAARQSRDPLGRGDAVGIEHTLHAEAVVGGGDDLAELADDRLLFLGVELLRAPEPGKGRARLRGVAGGEMRARQQDRALYRLRLRAAEGGEHGARAGVLAIHRLFGIGAQPRHAGPARKRIGRFGDLAAGHGVGAGGGDRPHQDMPVERVRGQIVAHHAGAGDVARGERVEAALQLRDRAARRQLPGLDRGGRGRLAGDGAGGDGGVDGRRAGAGIGALERQRADRGQLRVGKREARRHQQRQARDRRADTKSCHGAWIHGVSIPVPDKIHDGRVWPRP
jgi:hypothetical protein